MKHWIWLLPLLALLAAGCSAGGKGADPNAASLSFHSFEGGGPEYSFEVKDPELVRVRSERKYQKINHAQLTGAGYDVILTLSGLKPGETVLQVSARSPIADNWDQYYAVRVDENLQVTLTELAQTEDPSNMGQGCELAMETGTRTCSAALEPNPAAEALTEKLNSGALELEFRDTTGLGPTALLPFALPASEESITVEAGALVLCGEDELFFPRESTRMQGVLLADFGELPPELAEEGTHSVCLWLQWYE